MTFVLDRSEDVIDPGASIDSVRATSKKQQTGIFKVVGELIVGKQGVHGVWRSFVLYHQFVSLCK